MSVELSCPVPNGAVDLNVTAQQRLRYTITDERTAVVFELQDHVEEKLLWSEGPDRQCEWPEPGSAPPAEPFVTHPLGMQFVARGTLRWKVELLSRNGHVLGVVKDCTYTNDGGNDEFFDGLLISFV